MDGMTAMQSAAQSSGVIMPGLAGVKVLLVEDEWLVAMLVEELLGEIGCEVGGVAASVAEAQSRIESGVEFDVAILDVNLGGEKSFPVAEVLRGRGIPGKEAGDLYLLLEVVLPPAHTDKQRELYQTMAREMAFNPRAGG